LNQNANQEHGLMEQMKIGAKDELRKAQINEDKVNRTEGVDTNPNPENLTMAKMRENFSETFTNLKTGAAETIDSIKQAVGLAPKADHLPIPEHGQDAYDKTAPMCQTMFTTEESKVHVHYEPAKPHPCGSPSAQHPHWQQKYHSPKSQSHQDAYDQFAPMGQDLFESKDAADKGAMKSSSSMPSSMGSGSMPSNMGGSNIGMGMGNKASSAPMASSGSIPSSSMANNNMGKAPR